MKITSSEYLSGKCRLSLPRFTAECDSEEASAGLMSEFFDSIRKGAISYAEETPGVRRYAADFTCESADGSIKAAVVLTCRKISDTGGITTARRQLVTLWCGTTLKEFTVRDL